MRLLCLDLSTNTGWSLILNGALLEYGVIKGKAGSDNEAPDYPMNFIRPARHIALEIHKLITRTRPELIVIEETNKGKNRFSQKQLEFIHYSTNIIIDAHPLKPKLSYIDTSEWRWLLGMSLDKDQKKHNTSIKEERARVVHEYEIVYHSQHGSTLDFNIASAKGKLQQKRVLKEYVKTRDAWIKDQMKGYRVKKEGKVIGKLTMKHLSVNHVNAHYCMQFKNKDNDITDSICLGLAYEKKLVLPAPSL